MNGEDSIHRDDSNRLLAERLYRIRSGSMTPPADGLGPLFSVSQEEIDRGVRRREDRDVLFLRIEIEAQRREVARLMALLEECRTAPPPPPDESLTAIEPDRLLLTARELRKAIGVSTTTLWRWVRDGKFPPQVRIGSLVRWRRSEVGAWWQARAEERAIGTVARERPRAAQRAAGGGRTR